MAEAFGVAAGVVGIASLGVQLVDSAKKIKDLSRTNRTAMADVQRLATTLETLDHLLQQLCANAQARQLKGCSERVHQMVSRHQI